MNQACACRVVFSTYQLIASAACLFPAPLFIKDGGAHENDQTHPVEWEFVTGDRVLLQSHGADCGIYALLAAAESHGVPFDVRQLLTQDVMRHGAGMSVGDLVEATESIGLVATPMRNLNLAALLCCDHPVILNLHRRNRLQTTGHWVAYLGVEEDELVIFDPATESKMIRMLPSELLLRWQGDGVVISSREMRGSPPLLFLWSILPILTVFTFACIVASLTNSLAWWQRLSALLASSGVVVAVQYFGDRGQPLRDPTAIHWLSARYEVDDDLPTVSKSQFIDSWTQQRALIVDARERGAFQRFRLRQSVNLPINAHLDEFRRITYAWSTDRPIIVYCVGPSCSWAKSVAARLRKCGFQDVAVFHGGLQALSTESLPEDAIISIE